MDEVSPDVAIIEVVLEQRWDLNFTVCEGTKEEVRHLWAHFNRTDVNRTVDQIVADFAFWVLVEHFSGNPGDFSWGVASHRLVMQ